MAATTHYAELKAYAHTTEGATNAAVEFDLETLSPTYRLSIGLPGRSQAFAIAEQLGLAEPIVSDARSRLSEAQRTFEATLAQIRTTEGETTDALARARAAEARAADALRAADEERRRARRERDESRAAAREEAERLLRDVQADVEALRRTLERDRIAAPALDEALGRIQANVARLPGAVPASAVVNRAEPRTWVVGERARSRTGGWEGRISGIERGGATATLESGGMRVRVPVADLVDALSPAALDRAGGTPETSSSVNALRLARTRTVPASLDLRGARVEEAMDALDRYLQDASLAGLSRVTVIHGLGTGALRDAVRTAAAGHPLAGEVRAGGRGEGGDGATIVSLG